MAVNSVSSDVEEASLQSKQRLPDCGILWNRSCLSESVHAIETIATRRFRLQVDEVRRVALVVHLI